MKATEIIENLVIPIAKDGFTDAQEILQIISLMRVQNSNNVNKNLSNAGAGGAAITARNALIARLTLLVSRCYSRSREGDLHIGRAYELIARDQRVSAELSRRGPKTSVKDAQAIWARCKGDHRLARIDHFRHKFTAHISTPNAEIPIPNYDELFSFAVETTKVIQALAHVAGANNHELSDWNDELKAAAEAFWKPWVS